MNDTTSDNTPIVGHPENCTVKDNTGATASTVLNEPNAEAYAKTLNANAPGELSYVVECEEIGIEDTFAASPIAPPPNHITAQNAKNRGI